MITDNVNKRMPFHENPEYLDNLIKGATEKAISEGRKLQKHSLRPRFMQIAASLAILMTLSGLGWTYYDTLIPAEETQNSRLTTQNQTTSPLDQFLSKTTDQQAQAINYYEIETINDYE